MSGRTFEKLKIPSASDDGPALFQRCRRNLPFDEEEWKMLMMPFLRWPFFPHGLRG